MTNNELQIDERAMQLAGLFSNLVEAGIEEMKEREKDRQINEVIQESLGDPERGSYLWWVSLARQNTGSAMCDSGRAYGYGYNKPYKLEDEDAVSIEIWSDEVMVSVSLTHFLNTMFDATHPTAVALEEVHYWVANYLYPGEHWLVCADELKTELDILLNNVINDLDDEEPYLDKETYTARVKHITEDISEYDLPSDSRKRTREQYIQFCIDNLPVDAVLLLREEEVRESDEGGGFNIYNSENDLDQVFQCDGVFVDNYDDQFFILRTHNGCDVRGGYSNPVVAAANDPDYIWYWTADLYCHKCQHNGWEMAYSYNQEIEKMNRVIAPAWVDEKIRVAQIGVEIKNGQQSFASAPAKVTAEEMALLEHYRNELEAGVDFDEIKKPVALISMGDDRLVSVESLDSKTFPGPDVYLLCPDCGHYTVGAFSSANGF